MAKKRNSKKRKQQDDFDSEWQDDNFYFIAGYTSSGVPYGITWEEAYEKGFEEKEPIETEIDDDSLPF